MTNPLCERKITNFIIANKHSIDTGSLSGELKANTLFQIKSVQNRSVHEVVFLARLVTLESADIVVSLEYNVIYKIRNILHFQRYSTQSLDSVPKIGGARL